jgi:hypothetical protein
LTARPTGDGPFGLMSAIETIKQKLRAYPDLKFSEGANRITIHPASEDGFAVSLEVRQNTFAVSFEGWHEEFQSEDEALNCFAFGLASECRLRVELRGRMPVRWTVEHLEEGEWREDSTVGLIFTPFWRRRRVVYLRNDIVPVE